MLRKLGFILLALGLYLGASYLYDARVEGNAYTGIITAEALTLDEAEATTENTVEETAVTVETKKSVDCSFIINTLTKENAAQFDTEGLFSRLHDINEDIVAWIHIPAVSISYPVLQGQDNQEYLRTNLNKEDASSGSVFLESKNASDVSDLYNIIYGHNMKDGSMFAGLHKLNMENTANQPYFFIITPDGVQVYEYFSVRKTDTTDAAYNYGYTANHSSYAQFVEGSIAASEIEFGTEVDAADQTVTLSTCIRGDLRLVVQGVRVA